MRPLSKSPASPSPVHPRVQPAQAGHGLDPAGSQGFVPCVGGTAAEPTPPRAWESTWAQVAPLFPSLLSCPKPRSLLILQPGSSAASPEGVCFSHIWLHPGGGHTALTTNRWERGPKEAMFSPPGNVLAPSPETFPDVHYTSPTQVSGLNTGLTR